MKKFLVLATLLSGAAFADQCAYITHDEAARAVLLLQKGAVVGYSCAPCGDVGINEIEVVSSAVVASANFQDFSQVLINGKGVDLAYTYIQTSPKKMVNLAKAIACEALDQKSVPSTLRIK